MAAPATTRADDNTALVEKMRRIAMHLIARTPDMARYRDKPTGTPWVVLYQFIGTQKEARALTTDNGSLYRRMAAALAHAMMQNADYVIVMEGTKVPVPDPTIQCKLYPLEAETIATAVAQLPRAEMIMPCIVPLCSAWIDKINPPVLRCAIMNPRHTVN